MNNEEIIISCFTHYSIIEFTDIISKKSSLENLDKRLKEWEYLLANGLETKSFFKKVFNRKRTNSHLSHNLHYYKAKFFPRLARCCLNIAYSESKKGHFKVVDNFVGSGTTLVEASLLGMESRGYDIDPLSVQISNQKINFLQSETLDLALQEVLRKFQFEYSSQKENSISDSNYSFEIPSWLKKNTKFTTELESYLRKSIGHHKSQLSLIDLDDDSLTFIQTLLSDAISRKVKLRFLGTGSGRFSLNVIKSEINDLFEKNLELYLKKFRAKKWLFNYLGLPKTNSKAEIKDAKHLSKNSSKFDFLLTSPPYIPAASGRESYAKARALAMTSLDVTKPSEIDSILRESMGSMNNKNGTSFTDLTAKEKEVYEWLYNDQLRKIKASPTAKYFLDIRKSLLAMKNILKDDATAIFVISKQSTFYEMKTKKQLFTIDLAEIFAEEAEKTGFKVEKTLDLKLKKNNRNARPRSIDDYYESIIFLRNRQEG